MQQAKASQNGMGDQLHAPAKVEEPLKNMNKKKTVKTKSRCTSKTFSLFCLRARSNF